jgi:hypothetical protein
MPGLGGLLVAQAVLALLAGCAPTTQATAPPPTAAKPPASDQASGRPSSSAALSITSPQDGGVVSGPTVHVVVALQGATIVSATTTSIRPDQGHIHLYVDNVLVSMNYGTEQDVTLGPGTHVLKAEFAASDHAPFSPRVWSNQVLVTVQ